MSVRRASHAGSWYTADGRQLRAELDDWLRKADQGGELGRREGQQIVYFGNIVMHRQTWKRGTIIIGILLHPIPEVSWVLSAQRAF